LKKIKRNSESNNAVFLIGYLGLIPFILLTVGIWFLPVKYNYLMEEYFVLYLSLITSFLSSIYWGAILFSKKNKKSNFVFILAVTPLVIIFIVSLLELKISLTLFIYLLLLNIIFFFEKIFKDFMNIPMWYLKLRSQLNLTLSIVIILFIFKL
tara:strand:+ start:680 stop:1138 length:459 start_codon:yes stop_codon:yes gene_type:complete